MLATNVKILSELRSFLGLILTDKSLLNKFSIREVDFSRSRKLPFELLVLLITRLCKKSLSIELEQFFECVGQRMPCSVSAFTQQRRKLSAEFFRSWNEVLQLSYYHYQGGQVSRWKGYRLIAGDGSCISLTNNIELQKYFGGQRNQQAGFTGARAFYYYDVLNELVIYSRLTAYRKAEINTAYKAMEILQEDMLAVYDRGFSCYKMIALHLWQEKERKFIIRAKENQRLARDFIQTGQASAIVQISPTPDAIRGLKQAGFIIDKHTLLTVRLIRVELPTQVEVLITNLWEQEGYLREDFKDLYFMRWHIETNISLQKNILQLESFSGLTPLSVEQDFYATVLITNLHSLLVQHAERCPLLHEKTKHRKYPVKINRNKSFGKLKQYLTALWIVADPAAILRRLYDRFTKDLIPIRKGRSFERVRKKIQARTKHKTYTNFKPAF